MNGGNRVVIDLNADLGEEQPYDELLFPLITSANIACGLHAGNPSLMAHSLRLARKHGVAAGAHPGFADRATMGRGTTQMSPAEIFNLVVYQVGALKAIGDAIGVRLHHMKPHGSLYNLAATSGQVADAVVTATRSVCDSYAVMGAPGSCLQAAAERHQRRFVAEAFLDRHYADDGTLVPRSHPQALLGGGPTAVAARAVELALAQKVQALSGAWLHVEARSLCVHGDTPDAVAAAHAVHQALRQAAVTLAPAHAAM